MNVRQGFFSLSLLVLPLVFLPGCKPLDWFKDSSTSTNQASSGPAGQALSDDVLVTINGKPVVTVESYEHDFDQLLEENPQLKQVLPFMPDARQNFLQGLANQEIVNLYIADRKIDQRPEYKKDLERMQRSLVRVLNTKYFAAEHPVKVSDSDVHAYYDTNKDKMQELVISRGGVQAMGVQFEKEADAQAFMNKVKGKSAQFMDIVKEQKLTDKVRDFKLVNKQSVGIDPVLRNKIASITSVPMIELVKVNDKTFWVINATALEEVKYRSFEEVKEPLRGLVEREKTNEALQLAIEAIKKDMNIVVNEDYFKKEQNAAEQAEVAFNQQQEANKVAATGNAPAQAQTKAI
jgi:hypothetical protein